MTAHITPAASVRIQRKAFGARVVLHNIDLTIARGEFLVVVGESGGGKSTLLRLLARLDTEFDGVIERDDPVAVGFQDSRLIPWKLVWENVVYGLEGPRRELRERALTALDEVGLRGRADAWPNTLSGGEGQRVALARALIREPALLLLDEPLGALDALTRLRMQALIRDLWRDHGLTVMLITHDVDEALLLADRIVVLSGGSIVDAIPLDFTGVRSRENPEFERARRRVLADLNVDHLESRILSQ